MIGISQKRSSLQDKLNDKKLDLTPKEQKWEPQSQGSKEES